MHSRIGYACIMLMLEGDLHDVLSNVHRELNQNGKRPFLKDTRFSVVSSLLVLDVK